MKWIKRHPILIWVSVCFILGICLGSYSGGELAAILAILGSVVIWLGIKLVKVITKT